MQRLIERSHGEHVAVIAHTIRADGDLSPSTVAPDELSERRNRLVSLPWIVLRQVHSDRVLAVDTVGAGLHGYIQDRPYGDALVTSQVGVALAVHAGDCAPVGFVGDDGTVAVAHAGWKGLEAGILESTVRQLNSSAVTAVVGPHIRKDRYEFGTADLARLSGRFGTEVVAHTNQGSPAFDLTAAIASELDRLDVSVASWSPDCTAEAEADYWSHRARVETGRIAMVGWIERAA